MNKSLSREEMRKETLSNTSLVTTKYSTDGRSFETIKIKHEGSIMKYFTIYWRHGTKSFIKGIDIADASKKAGIGAGAVPAIDWYKKGLSNTHKYDYKQKKWLPVAEEEKDYIDFSEFATSVMNQQSQYASSFLDKNNRIYLGEGLRLKGKVSDYHSLQIHKDDALILIERRDNYSEKRYPHFCSKN